MNPKRQSTAEGRVAMRIKISATEFSVPSPFNVWSDLPLEKKKLRSTHKLPLLPGILTYFHYDNMICVCVNARGEADESWRRAPLPLGPGRMPAA